MNTMVKEKRVVRDFEKLTEHNNIPSIFDNRTYEHTGLAPMMAGRVRRGESAATDYRRGNWKGAKHAMSNMQNAPTFESLLEVAKQLGEEAGKGRDTQIKFDLKVIEAAYLGSLDLDPNKHGSGVRDGMRLAEAYTRAQTGATIFDHKAAAGRKLISNIDKCIKLGSNPKWGAGEPLQTVTTLVSHRQNLRKTPDMAKRLDDAHNMVMRFATAQLKSDTLLTGDELYDFAFKKDPSEVTLEDVIEGVRKKLYNLKNGKVPHLHGGDASVEVQKAIDALTKRLKDLAKGTNAQTTV